MRPFIIVVMILAMLTALSEPTPATLIIDLHGIEGTIRHKYNAIEQPDN